MDVECSGSDDNYLRLLHVHEEWTHSVPIIAHWSKVHIGLNFNSSSAGFDGKGSMIEVLALNMLNISQLVEEESDCVMQPIPLESVHGEIVLSNVHIVQTVVTDFFRWKCRRWKLHKCTWIGAVTIVSST